MARLTNIDTDTDILRAPCQLVDLDDLKADRQKYVFMFDRMLSIMRDNNGIGLAANQAGYSLRMCIVAITKTPIYMINPRLLFISGDKVPALEGCLSCPGEQVVVKRSVSVVVEYYDLSGVKHKLRANGLTARCIQHEIDHLDGVVIRDHQKEKKSPALTQWYGSDASN